jgi:hypothetical protein
LRAVRARLGLRDKVRVIHGDGLAEITALLQAQAIGAASLVHVDPFAFRAAGPGVGSALELVTSLAAAGIPTFAWYGLTAVPACASRPGSSYPDPRRPEDAVPPCRAGQRA